MQRSEGRAPWGGNTAGTFKEQQEGRVAAAAGTDQGSQRAAKGSHEHARRLWSAGWLSSEAHLGASGGGWECASRGEGIRLRCAKTPPSTVWRVNSGLKRKRRWQGWLEGHCRSPPGGDRHWDKGAEVRKKECRKGETGRGRTQFVVRETRLTNGLDWRCGRQNTPHTPEMTLSNLLEPVSGVNLSRYKAEGTLGV